MLSCTTLIQYWSPEEYSGLDYSLGLPVLSLKMVFFNLSGLETLPLLYQILLYQASPLWIALLCPSWAIRTNVCGKKL